MLKIRGIRLLLVYLLCMSALCALSVLSACSGTGGQKPAGEAEATSIISGAVERPFGKAVLPAIRQDAARRLNIKFPDDVYTRQGPCYTVEIHKPYFGIPALDSHILAWRNELRDSSVRELEESCKYGQKNLFLKVAYETSATFGNVVAVLFLPSSYTGGAHSMTDVVTMNFDAVKGKLLGYSDIVANTAGLAEFLSDYTFRALRPKLGDNLFAEGFEPVEESFEHFILSPDGLVVIFPLYQVAPFSEGIQSCLVPLEELLRFSPRPGIWQ